MEQPNKPLTLGSLFDGSGGFPLAGNGVALPCVYFALAGIVYAHGTTAESE